MSTLPVSVCIIAKNEEQFLKGALEKLAPYGFEIIVVDTGSTDRTVEIARSYTKHVYFFSWINDFSAARNYAADHAGNDWIFALDCDEYIQECDTKELMRLLDQFPKGLGCIELENIMTDERTISKTNQSLARLYNKNFYRFSGRIHEQIQCLDTSCSGGFSVPIHVLHYGYALSAGKMKEKNERNISLLLKEIENNPLNPYFYFQLGQSYASIGDYENVFQYLQKGIDLQPDLKQEYVQHMYINYGVAMLNTKRYGMAMHLETLYDSLCQYSDYLFLLGRIYYANNKIVEALETFLQATDAPKCFVFGTNSFFPLHSIALIYEQFGEKEQADLFHKRADAALSAASMPERNL